MAEMKNEHEKMGSDKSTGSGSDTVSAAKISAGTSVGNVGESPMPRASGQGSQAGMGSSSGDRAQSSTLASHTSSPMGGTGSTGAGNRAPHRQGSQDVSGQQHAGSGQDQSGGGMADRAKQAAGQMQEKAGEAYEQASEWARDTYESAASWASDTMGHTGRRGSRAVRSMGNARQGVQNYVAQNPVMVGLVGLAAGLLLGALLPRTRKEDETFGEWADEVRQQGMRYAQDMTQRGREYVEQSFSGDDERFSRHESEFGGTSGGPAGPGPGATSRGQGANRH